MSSSLLATDADLELAAAPARIIARPLVITDDGRVVAPSLNPALHSTTPATVASVPITFSATVAAPTIIVRPPPSESASASAAANDAAELTIAVHPQWCHLSGRAASSELAQQLSYVIGDTFSRRCFSDEMTIAPGASGLPLEIGRLPELLLEMAAADRPVTLRWYPDTDRLVLSGESFGNVTRAAVELRLRMALAESTLAGASTTQIDNLIAVVDPPRSSSKNSEALALVIEREFSGADLPLLPEIQLHAIYFSDRERRVDAREMPKLIDVVDQLSTLRPIDDCPPLVITGYMVPNRDENNERASSLRRATAVRNQLMTLGVPEDRLTVESIPEPVAAGLTWRSGRVEIRLAEDPSKQSQKRLASLDL